MVGIQRTQLPCEGIEKVNKQKQKSTKLTAKHEASA